MPSGNPPQAEKAANGSATPPIISSKPDFGSKSKFKDAPKTTIKLSNLLKVEPRKEETATAEIRREPDLPFTSGQLKSAWQEFAETRRKLQAEYQLLTQEYELNESIITVPLHNPVQEMMLTNLRSDLTTFLRDRLKNQSINITGELRVADQRKVIYTNREKFDYLVAKNPMLKEFKDRLGLDTDF